MTTVTGLSDELTRVLFDAGPRRLVLVEGPDDAAVLTAWYHDRLSRLYFYPTGGETNIIRLLGELTGHEAQSRTYAIRDRDFRPAEQIATEGRQYQGHLITLPRYAIENYLLEPQAVWDELSLFIGEQFTVPDAAAMPGKLLEILGSLQTLMAANWVFSEQRKEDEVSYVKPGDEREDRAALLELSRRRLNFSPGEVDRLLAEKEALIAPTLGDLATAHTYINGKHVFHRVHKLANSQTKNSISSGHLFRLLIRRVKERTGIPSDIRAIIEGQILGEFPQATQTEAPRE